MHNKNKKTKQFLYDNFFGAQIQLQDNVMGDGISAVQLLRTGEFAHPSAPNGKFQITKETLFMLKENFRRNVRRLETQSIAVDYGHDATGKAAGWIKDLDLRNDDTELWIDVDWTEPASQAIENREWRLISADLDFQYRDNENPEVNHGPVLLGAGLTNRPHIKEMQAIFEEQTENQEKLMPEEIEKLKAKVLDLEAQLAAMKSKFEAKESDLSAAEGQLSETKESLKLSEEKVTKISEEKLNSEKEAKFNEMVTEGKVVPAQKESFMKLKLDEAVALFKDAQVLNLNEGGNAGDGKKGGEEKDGDKDVEAEVIKLAEKKMADNEGLSLTESISEVLSENTKLNEQYNKLSD